MLLSVGETLAVARSGQHQPPNQQGRTIAETIEIARDIAKKLIETQEDSYITTLIPVADDFDYPKIVGI